MEPDNDLYDEDERVTQTTRRNARQTERLRDTDASSGDTPREDWRRRSSRNVGGRTRRDQTLPASRQEAIMWLQRGGWRFVAIAAAVVFVIILVMVLNRRANSLPENTLADDTLPTSAIATGFDLPTQGSDPALGVVPPTEAPAVAPSDGAQFQVFGTETQGLFLRADPDAQAAVLTTMPDGSVVTIIGEDAPGPNYTWKHVRSADGFEGWAAADFLQPAP